MSICPNKDLHSVYLDNELPESYKAEYEKHVADCPKCQAELKKLKAVRSLFADDKNTIEFTQKEMDESYARLLSRMSYSKNVNMSKKPVSSKIKNSMGYVIGAIAAVCAFAFILPNRAAMLKVSPSTDFRPIARTGITPAFSSTVSFDGTLTSTDVSSVFAAESQEDYYSQVAAYNSLNAGSYAKPSSSFFTSYDVFYTEPVKYENSSNQDYFATDSLEKSKVYSELSRTNLLFKYNSAYNPD